MKAITKAALALLIISAFALPLAAQEEDQTIEELFLQSAIRVQIIRTEASSPDRDLKLIALKDIEQMIDEGQVGEDSEIVEILGDLSREGVAFQVREQGAVVNDFPIVRREAARLLGEVGTEEANQALQGILLNDPEPMVMSEAVVAIAKNAPLDGSDNGETLRVMGAAMYRQTAYNKDNNFAYAYQLSIESLYSRGYPVTDPFVFEEVAKIADPRGGYNRVVREKALRLLKDLQDI